MIPKLFRSLAVCLGMLVSGAVSIPAANPEAFDPPALYLAWSKDPSTTMIVRWHTVEEAKPEVYYRMTGSTNWTKGGGSTVELPKSQRLVHTVHLTGLRPATRYEFCFWPEEKTFAFRTAPAQLDRPFRFVSGGDVYHEKKWMDAMNALAGNFDPEFVVLGGDLAYSCGKKDAPEKMERWDDFFASWKTNGRAPDGRLIPLLVAIGNHELPGSWHQPKEAAKVFNNLFLEPGQEVYSALDFGRYLSLLLLDSGHITEVAGAQTEWLQDALKDRKKIPHKFPVYHIPAYPSFRSDSTGENADITQAIRKHWVPLFETGGVKIAFENHDHAYKRSHPLLRGKIDERGVTYLGDGAWGVNLRKPDPTKPRWYLARADAIRHLYVVTLLPESRQVLAVNENGQIFDEVFQRTK
jgi:hypothetical protein